MPLAVLPIQLESAAVNLALDTCSDPITYQQAAVWTVIKYTYCLLWLDAVTPDDNPSQLLLPSW